MSLITSSIQTPLSAKAILLKQGSLLIILHSTNRGCSNTPVGGAQRTSQQQKWAKPWTASSVVLLSYSSLGLPLGIGLEGEDRHLAMNWHNQLKSLSPCQPRCLSASLRQIWYNYNYRPKGVQGAFVYICLFICIPLRRMMQTSLFKATSKPTNPVCIIQEIKKDQKVNSAAISHICSISPHLYR